MGGTKWSIRCEVSGSARISDYHSFSGLLNTSHNTRNLVLNSNERETSNSTLDYNCGV